MKRTSPLPLAALLLITASCTRAPEAPPSAGHGEEAHEHEARHDQMPRTVELSEAVIEKAGIATTEAKQRTITPTVRLPGEIVAPPDHEAAVAARIDGIIEAVAVQPGDVVSRGDALATVRAPNLQALRSAETALRARAASARANAERLDGLVDKRMASKQEAVAAAAEADALAAEARAARQRLRALGVRGGQAVTFDVRAPMDGIVLERSVVVGSPVTPETVVARLVADDEVWFLGHVFERDVTRVATESPAAVHLNAYPEETFAGVVEYVSHQVDPGARTLTARIPLPNPDGKLRLGLYGTAHVATSGVPTEPVVAVPNSAVTRMAGTPVVFVQHADGHFEVHEVVLGRSDTEYTEVVHGVLVGERVVSKGAFSVKSAMLRDSFAEGGH